MTEAHGKSSIVPFFQSGAFQSGAIKNRSSPGMNLRNQDTHGRFPEIFYKGDIFCDFLFDILQASPNKKRDLL